MNNQMDNLPINGFVEADDEQQQRGGPDMERVRNARKRRMMQMKRWTQYDKAKEKEEFYRHKKGFPQPRKGFKSVRFSQNLILLEAGNHGDTEEVRRLLMDGVCADAANSDGLTALHQCAINKNIDMCRVLINYAANVNAKDKELWTPLHAAAICGHTEICLLLIRNGADLLALNTDGNMPYDICEDEITLDAIENEMASRGITQEMINEARNIPEKAMLRDLQSVVSRYGPTVALHTFSQLDKQGANCLHVAATCGYVEVIRYLIVLAMPLDLVDKDGWLAIHVAALYNQLEVIEVLVSHGANLDAQTKQGETVYELVYDKEMYDKLLLLKREIEKLKDNQGVISSVGLVRRRSSTNPRSASIRRTSTKDKSVLSWKEARQEAELRMTAEGGHQEKNNNNKVEEFVNSSLRGRHNAVPETIAETECHEQECDVTDVSLDMEHNARTSLVFNNNNKDLRASFTHSHPYNSPTRDPDTFPYNPKPTIANHSQKVTNVKPAAPPVSNHATTPTSGESAKTRHNATNDRSLPRNMNSVPHTVRSSQDNLDQRPPSVRSTATQSNKSLSAAQRSQIIAAMQPQRTSVASLKTGSSHTTPIGSIKSSSQLSLHRTPPPLTRDGSRKAIQSRYYKTPKHDSCCLVM